MREDHIIDNKRSLPPRLRGRRLLYLVVALVLLALVIGALIVWAILPSLATTISEGSSSEHCLWNFTFLSWEDLNRDGISDPGEPFLPGVIIDSRPDFMPFAEEWGTTNGAGSLAISNVYTLCNTRWHFVGTPPSGYRRTTPRIIEATSSGTYYFGFVHDPGE